MHTLHQALARGLTREKINVNQEYPTEPKTTIHSEKISQSRVALASVAVVALQVSKAGSVH